MGTLLVFSAGRWRVLQACGGQTSGLLLKTVQSGTSLVVQWLTLHAPKARGLGFIPAQGTRFHMLQLKSSHAKTRDPARCDKDQRFQVPQLRPSAAK